MVITHAPPKTVCSLLGGKTCQVTVTLPDGKYLTGLDPKMNCASDLEKNSKLLSHLKQVFIYRESREGGEKKEKLCALFTGQFNMVGLH